MVRGLHKGKGGTANNYLTRAQALRKLQISLPQFRKLCILKGIYPRDPKKKVKGRNQSYYYTKDIMYLMHDPVLEKLRDQKAWLKKVSRAKGRNQPLRLNRLVKQRPVYYLDHIIKERYPTFPDALREIDDVLSLLHLYAHLPATKHIKQEVISNCLRLCLEFQTWVLRTKSLRKVFISIKGIYYQADIANEKVTWIVPHQFSQQMPNDVDYRVFNTFIEFYQTLMCFINYKLYNNIGLHYPPLFDKELIDYGEELFAVIIKENDQNEEDSEDEDDDQEDSYNSNNKNVDDDDESDEEQKIFNEPISDELKELKNLQNLFKGLTFFISREVPRHSFQFMIQCFGGNVSWEGSHSPLPENSPKITHHIVDRPSLRTQYDSRDYVQPQWIVDSINAGILLPIEEYAFGVTELPPHLSPFVEYDSDGYIPARAKKIMELQGKQLASNDSDEESDEEDEDMSDYDSEQEEIKEAESNYVDELKAEKEGIAYSKIKKQKAQEQESLNKQKSKKKKLLKQKESKENKELASIMIQGNKNRQLYKNVTRIKNRKLEKQQNLKTKAKKLQYQKQKRSKKHSRNSNN